MYSVGVGGSTIRVVGVEQGKIINPDGSIAFQWS